MDRDILKSAVDDIKAGEEFKKRVTNLMIEKYNSKARIKKSYKGLIAAASMLIIFGVIATFSIKYITNSQDSTGGVCIPSGIQDMFIYNEKLYYTDMQNRLYLYDSSLGKGKIISQLTAGYGYPVFEYKGYVYYSTDSAIYDESLKGGTPEKILTGKFLAVDAVEGGRLFYHIGYKDKSGGFSEFECHIYDLSTGKDTVLFKRSNNMWHILDIDKDTIIADGYMPIIKDGAVTKDDSGIFSIDAKTGTYKKLSGMQILGLRGFIEGDKFYFVNESAQLYSICLNDGKAEQIQLSDSNKQGYAVDSISVNGDILYAGIRYYTGKQHVESNGQIKYDEQHNVVSMNLETGNTSILLTGASNRITNLCTDGKTLYAYDAGFPYNEKGNITIINLK